MPSFDLSWPLHPCSQCIKPTTASNMQTAMSSQDKRTAMPTRITARDRWGKPRHHPFCSPPPPPYKAPPRQFQPPNPKKSQSQKNRCVFKLQSANRKFTAQIAEKKQENRRKIAAIFGGGGGIVLPKGPRHTKNGTHSEFTICKFATRSDSLLKM